MRYGSVCFLLFFILILLTWLFLQGGRLAAQENSPTTKDLITNGGFEDGGQGWTLAGKVVDDPKQAHTGSRCVFGEVTKPKQAQNIRRALPLRPGVAYTLCLWARATNGAKVAIWLQGPTGRKNLSQEENIPPRWQKREVRFSVEQAGQYDLQLAAPASFNAPIGKMWIDDISLTETVLPPALNVTQDKGFCDRPAFGVDKQGRVFIAWIAFEKDQDCVRAALIGDAATDRPAVARTWDVPMPEGGDVESVALLGSDNGVLLAASCETEKNWEIVLCSLTDSGPSVVTNLTQDPATDVRPALGVCGGSVYLAWESNRDGFRQIYVGRLVEGKLADVCRLSKPDTNNNNPTIAGDDSGGWVAWESFRNNSYDVFGAQLSGGRWGDEKQLTQDPRLEHRPFLAMRRGEAWMAWEAITFRKATTSASADQRVVVAKMSPTGLLSTPNIYDLLPNWSGHPSMAFDTAGNLWLAARVSRGKNGGWDVMVRRFDGTQWSPAQPITGGQGRAQYAPIAVAGDRVLVASQVDNMTRQWQNVVESQNARSHVELCSLSCPAPASLEPRLAPFELPKTDFTAAPLRQQWAEDSPRHTIEYNGRKLGLYFGQFHEHSEISQCNRRGDLPPEDNYTHNRDIHREDFSALTDHGYNICSQVWHFLGKLGRTQHDPGRYVTFLAEEWTSTFEKYSAEHPYGYYGHRNLIFADPHFYRWFNEMNGDTPAQVWAVLRKDKANFIHIPHQLADTGNVPTDWNFTDEVAQPVAEIFQNRQSYECKECPRQAKNTADGYFIQDAWAKGIIIGVIASPDHGGGQGKAAIFAPELTREALLDACRARHTYGTSGAKIFLDARVNGHLMGEKHPGSAGPVEVTAKVIGAGDIERVDVCRNNVFIYSCPGKGREASFKYMDTSPLDKTGYYYVRVVQKDGELAWSSPVWLTK
jgi:hypothetical protein